MATKEKLRRKHQKNRHEQKIKPSSIVLTGILASLFAITFMASYSISKEHSRAKRVELDNIRQGYAQATATAQAGNLDIADHLSENDLNSIVKIWALPQDELDNYDSYLEGFCTGTILNVKQIEDSLYEAGTVQTDILTDKHCLQKDDDSVSVSTPSGNLFAGHIDHVQSLSISHYQEEDAVVIITILSRPEIWQDVQQFTNSPFTLSATQPIPGETVTQCGYPMGIQQDLDAIMFCSTEQVIGMEGPLLVTTGNIPTGMSGQPIINSQNEIVALTRGPLSDEITNEGFHMPIEITP